MTKHIPVLLKEAVDALCLSSGAAAVDATLGGGGHSREILKRILPGGKLIAMDRDAVACEAFRKEVEKEYGELVKNGNIRIVNRNFADMADTVRESGVEKVDAVLADLGISSDQLEDAGKGLSFQIDAPLDMRLSDECATSAADIVNGWKEQDIARILREYGEERYAAAIARKIAAVRKKRTIRTTKELAEIVWRAVPPRARYGKIHSATKTFQALRMAVNREPENLNRFLEGMVKCVRQGGRVAIISFHSGEDRAVKNFFRQNARGCVCGDDAPVCRCGGSPRMEIVTKKPITPSLSEQSENPRSRSAKLRVAEVI